MKKKKTGIPSDEIEWTSYSKGDKVFYIITSKKQRDMYFLYKADENGEFERIGKAKEPPELEEKYNVFDCFK